MTLKGPKIEIRNEVARHPSLDPGPRGGIPNKQQLYVIESYNIVLQSVI